ncbi:MAG: hypothetical protein C7B46_01150 [Sulfobacillus benefaciens]|uniref:YjbQ family protein n=1 Tax=Sulfobacillus benefaciens TaxID=453960 RepID=A0A2T2XLD3_9FIRM|nr:MAG: hypothetical protein C7B46_01150 [Sulfobacillus benefaciens]
MFREIQIQTAKRREFLDITQLISDMVQELDEGIVVVFSPHTTAAVTINENWDPDVLHDVLLFWDRQVPRAIPGFRHGEGNSDSHILTSIFGPSITVMVHNGKLKLGHWQGIYLCEFDGPRMRNCWIQTVST